MKLYYSFSHPLFYKFLNILKLEKQWRVDKRTKEILDDKVRRCAPCQRIRTAPHRFTVPLQEEENLVFGEQQLLDLMFLDGKTALRIAGTAIRFSAVTFLDAHG